MRSLRDEVQERGWRPSAEEVATRSVGTHVQNACGAEPFGEMPGAAADGLMRTPLHHPGLQMGGGSQRHERNGSGYEEPAPKDRTGTHNRERLVDGRLRSTEGPIITSKWRARTAVEGAEVLTSDSEYEH